MIQQKVDRIQRIYSLDLLRGVLAISILVYHFAHWTQLPLPFAIEQLVDKFGRFAVQQFFFISGFSIYFAYRNAVFSDWRTIALFYTKRFFRLAPLFTFASIGTIWLQNIEFSFSQLILNITLAFAFVSPADYIPTGGWSIGVEMIFYLFFPILLWSVRCFGFIIVLALSAALSWGALAGSYFYPEVFRYTEFPHHIFLFASGMCAAGVLLRERVLANKYLQLWAWPLFAISVFCFVFAFPVSKGLVFPYAAVREIGLQLSVIVLSLTTPYVLEGYAWVRSWWAKTLGDLSYSIYLLHPLAMYFWTKFSGLRMTYVALLALVTTFLGAYLIYYKLEKPLANLPKRFWPSSRNLKEALS